MTAWTAADIALVPFLVVGVSLLSGKRVEGASDSVDRGKKTGPFLVCGTIVGSLVSSQVTVGIAQLAFHYGLVAWWFALRVGIGCLILGVTYARPLRDSGCITELQVISRSYGAAAGSLGSILCFTDTLIGALVQVVAHSGLAITLFPHVPVWAVALASTIIICFYVIFGGAWGAEIGGIIKLVLLYAASLVGMVYALSVSHGIGGIFPELIEQLCGTGLGLAQQSANGVSNLKDTADLTDRYGNPVARGAMKDIGPGLSLALGVLSTQTYAQAVLSAESDRRAKWGALLSAMLIPPLRTAGICIGLLMCFHYMLQAETETLKVVGMATPDLLVLTSTIQVFPTFVLDYMPPLLAGIVLGTLLITSVGGEAELSLGMATILIKDIYQRMTTKRMDGKKELAATRGIFGVILVTAACVALLVPGSTINDLGFLSMGPRGPMVLVPMSCALWLKYDINKRWVLMAVVLAPAAVLVGKLLALPIDSLYLGVLISVLCCCAGGIMGGEPGRRRICDD